MPLNLIRRVERLAQLEAILTACVTDPPASRRSRHKMRLGRRDRCMRRSEQSKLAKANISDLMLSPSSSSPVTSGSDSSSQRRVDSMPVYSPRWNTTSPVVRVDLFGDSWQVRRQACIRQRVLTASAPPTISDFRDQYPACACLAIAPPPASRLTAYGLGSGRFTGPFPYGTFMRSTVAVLLALSKIRYRLLARLCRTGLVTRRVLSTGMEPDFCRRVGRRMDHVAAGARITDAPRRTRHARAPRHTFLAQAAAYRGGTPLESTPGSGSGIGVADAGRSSHIGRPGSAPGRYRLGQARQGPDRHELRNRASPGRDSGPRACSIVNAIPRCSGRSVRRSCLSRPP
jgi:hypothetical protein